MEYLFGSYFIYLLTIGLFYFSVQYLIYEKKIVDWSEFLLLVLLSIIGVGRWHYQRKLRKQETTQFSREWYVWKKMIPIHKIFVGILAGILVFFTITFITSDLFGKNRFATNVYSEIFQIFGEFFAEFLMFVLLIFLYGVLIVIWLILVVIPKGKVRSIEKRMQNSNKDFSLPSTKQSE